MLIVIGHLFHFVPSFPIKLLTLLILSAGQCCHYNRDRQSPHHHSYPTDNPIYFLNSHYIIFFFIIADRFSRCKSINVIFHVVVLTSQVNGILFPMVCIAFREFSFVTFLLRKNCITSGKTKL